VSCYAIRSGIAKDEVWSQVANIGRFAEQGQRYFDLTWANAEYDARASTFEKLQKPAGSKGRKTPTVSDASDAESGGEVLPDGEGYRQRPADHCRRYRNDARGGHAAPSHR
jgi:hypothetical protein